MIRQIMACTFILLAYADLAQAAADRIALVMGNSGYQTLPRLRNPVNDARLMTKTLQASGFVVITVLDADQKTMKRAMLRFTRRLRKTGASGLFYYAGHGVQVAGENYLIPLGIDLQDESEVEIEAINVNAFVATMENTQNPINIVILDACRNNPFPGSTRSTSRGLARVSAPRGTFVAYSTAPGQVAQDGDGANSPYTTALAAAMSRPGLSIEQVFKRARIDVLKATDDAQIPWENSSITGDFFFKNPIKDVRGESNNLELSLWNLIKDSTDTVVFRQFLKRFPRGVFALIAKSNIRKLEGRKLASLNKPVDILPQAIIAPHKAKPKSTNAVKIIIPEPVTVVPDNPEFTDKRAMTRALQTELKRVGCIPGKIDGYWGRNGRDALKKFNHFSNKSVPVSSASIEAYSAIRQVDNQVCPAACGLGTVINGKSCKPVVTARTKTRKKTTTTTRPSRTTTKSNAGCFTFNGKTECD